MLKPKGMIKITAVAPKRYQSLIIEKLYSQKVLHIIEHSKSTGLDIGKPLQNSAILSETLVKIRSLLSYFKGKKFQQSAKDAENTTKKIKVANANTVYEFKTKELHEEIIKLHEQVASEIKDYKDTEQEIKRRKIISSKAYILKNLELNLELIGQYDSLHHYIGHIESTDGITSLLKSATQRMHVKISCIEGKHIISVFADKEYKDKVYQVLEKHKFQPIDFSDLQNELQKDKDFEKLDLNKIQEKTIQFENKKEKLQQKLISVSKKHTHYLEHAEKFVVRELEKAEAPLKFASTEDTFIVSGWVPEDKLERTFANLQKITKGKIYIEIKKPGHHDNTPVQFNNPKPVEPFEFLMELFSIPKYNELDPTFFMFLTFPLFFGFMLGDFGYGLITLIAFILMKKFMPQFKAFFSILIFSSIATIFFGLIFGEFFGYEQLAGFAIPHLLSRSEQIMDLLTLSLIIGAIHVTLGLLIGFYNEMMHHGFVKAFMEKISWIILEVAVIVGYFVNILAGVVIGAIAIILLGIGEGVKGLIEIPSIFSNILSYARLMALGVASVKLAEVINHFAGQMFISGARGIIFGILLLVIGHVINIALGIMGPFLHSLRLHYVEFFTKFYSGGGTSYNPFGREAD